jgi:hypothetical protein
MAIATNDAIYKFGTQDEVTSGTPATISDGGFGKADQGASVNFTNDDDAPLAAAVLKVQFDTTMPTTGTIDLYAHLLNVQSTNDVGVPDANNETLFVGSFLIDFGVANDVDFYTVIELFRMPGIATSQAIDWYLKNNGTGQTIGVSWQLYITPITEGPKA